MYCIQLGFCHFFAHIFFISTSQATHLYHKCVRVLPRQSVLCFFVCFVPEHMALSLVMLAMCFSCPAPLFSFTTPPCLVLVLSSFTWLCSPVPHVISSLFIVPLALLSLPVHGHSHPFCRCLCHCLWMWLSMCSCLSVWLILWPCLV